MSSLVYLLLASTTACIIWATWRHNFFKATTLQLNLPLIEFGDGDESKTRYAKETGKLLKKGYDELFAHMSARVMVGAELCGGWPAISLQYLNAALKAPGVVRAKYHPWLYWSAKYFNPEAKDVVVLEARHASFKRAEAQGKGGTFEKHDDFIQWLMDEHRARGRDVTPDQLVQDIFITMVASMHGTSSIAYSVLLDLLAHPETLADIKEEIDLVIRNELHGEQVWSRHTLGELRLLDSFMRETHRMHAFTEATMQRTVVQPHTFKDGLSLPAGISVNFTSLQHSMDQEIYGADADTFDPRRWLKKRQNFDTSKFQFASTSDDWLSWGGGSHACLGRFLADVTIKLILIYLITNCDMKYPDGVAKRPEDGRRNLMITPDMATPILFKSFAV
ncbi:hypothetical protein Daus18300_011166 [Diaporthe australafricana]|uniref:Cytochrome P450 n=1 Tax=Diaporthe australafricana TaxID=127596 RepID=A0ABR3W866_9PEZI